MEVDRDGWVIYPEKPNKFFAILGIGCATLCVLIVLAGMVFIWNSAIRHEDDFSGHIKRGKELLATTFILRSGDLDLMPTEYVDAMNEFQTAASMDPMSYEANEGIANCYGYMSTYFSGPKHIELVLDEGFYLRKIVGRPQEKLKKADQLADIYKADYFEGDMKAARTAANEAVSLNPEWKDAFFKGYDLVPPSTKAEDHSD